VHYFSKVDRCAWNSLILHSSGGLLYGREVRKPEYFKATRRRAYRPCARWAKSKRRAEVMERVIAGMKVAEIARALGISNNTVAGYMKVIYRERGVHSRRELQGQAATPGRLDVATPAILIEK
jgi:DNA-binding NarL/FixJ family response regulator